MLRQTACSSHVCAGRVLCSKPWLLLQVTLGKKQKHTSRAARAMRGQAVWDQRLNFIGVLPLTNCVVRLVLLTTDSVAKPGKALAHAYIPLSSLLPPLDSGEL